MSKGMFFNDSISIENGAYVYGSIRHNAAPPPVANGNGNPPKLIPDQSELKLPVGNELQNLRVVSGRN